jgi:hypothetical protein
MYFLGILTASASTISDSSAKGAPHYPAESSQRSNGTVKYFQKTYLITSTYNTENVPVATFFKPRSIFSCLRSDNLVELIGSSTKSYSDIFVHESRKINTSPYVTRTGFLFDYDVFWFSPKNNRYFLQITARDQRIDTITYGYTGRKGLRFNAFEYRQNNMTYQEADQVDFQLLNDPVFIRIFNYFSKVTVTYFEEWPFQRLDRYYDI